MVHCTEKERKNEEGQDPILVNTCFYKNFKFISTAYPDYAGRYIYYEREVFVRVNNKYVKTTNDKVFNKTQDKLVALLNKRIKEDFDKLSSDTSTRECFTEVGSLPR